MLSEADFAMTEAGAQPSSVSGWTIQSHPDRDAGNSPSCIHCAAYKLK